MHRGIRHLGHSRRRWIRGNVVEEREADYGSVGRAFMRSNIVQHRSPLIPTCEFPPWLIHTRPRRFASCSARKNQCFFPSTRGFDLGRSHPRSTRGCGVVNGGFICVMAKRCHCPTYRVRAHRYWRRMGIATVD